MQHHLTRYELLLAACALACAVAGVIVLTQPARPAHQRAHPVARVQISPSPAASPAAVQPSPSAAPSPTPPATRPSPAPVAAAVSASGPTVLSPWRMSTYVVSFQVQGVHTVSVWWSGAAMARWAWSRVDGHSVLESAGQDRLTWQVNGPGTIELYLTPSGAPGGHLVIQGRDGDGQTVDLAAADVPQWSG